MADRSAPWTGPDPPSAPAVDPEAWEAGCHEDAVRNELVVPHLEVALNSRRPKTVLDLGAGTGYIARALVSRGYASDACWVLVDRDDSLLELAARSMPRSCRVATLHHDLTVPIDSLPDRFIGDCAFMAFTPLEFRVTAEVARNCALLLRPGGQLFIYLPDVLPDVLEAEQRAPGSLAGYVRGHHALQKNDRFTGTPYPFHANRTEQITATFLAAGMRLRALGIARRPDKPIESFYSFTFERD